LIGISPETGDAFAAQAGMVLSPSEFEARPPPGLKWEVSGYQPGLKLKTDQGFAGGAALVSLQPGQASFHSQTQRRPVTMMATTLRFRPM
jgi:hypothetical protein